MVKVICNNCQKEQDSKDLDYDNEIGICHDCYEEQVELLKATVSTN